MTIICQKAGCGQPATHAMQIACGTYTDPEDGPVRAKILMDVVLCENHLDEADAGRFLESDPALGQMLALAMNGGPPPDLARARVIGVPMNSPEWTELQAQRLRDRN